MGEAFLDHSPLYDGAQAIICMPVLYHVEPETFESITIAMSKYGREKVRFMAQEKTVVHESRNRLAYRFLATDAEWMITADGDMGYPCGDAYYFRQRFRNQIPEHVAGMNFIERILLHEPEKLIVGGSYFDRQIGTQLQNSRGCGSRAEIGFNDRFRAGEYYGVHEVLWTATGLMRIHRSVFEAMKKHAEQKFPEIIPVAGRSVWGFFTPVRAGMGEDVAFCARARALGIKIWWDAELRAMHKGHCFF